MWMEVYYEQKVLLLQTEMFINRAGGIVHFVAPFFHKRLRQNVEEALFGSSFWRISLIELRICGLMSSSATIFS